MSYFGFLSKTKPKKRISLVRRLKEMDYLGCEDKCEIVDVNCSNDCDDMNPTISECNVVNRAMDFITAQNISLVGSEGVQSRLQKEKRNKIASFEMKPGSYNISIDMSFKEARECGISLYWFNNNKKEGYTINSYSDPMFVVSLGVKIMGKYLNLTDKYLYLEIEKPSVLSILNITVERIDNSKSELFYYSVNGIEYPSTLKTGLRIYEEPDHVKYNTELSGVLGYIYKFRQTYIIEKVPF